MNILKFIGKAILTSLIIIVIMALCLWLMPDLEASQEPNWNKLIPIIIILESNNNNMAVSEDGCIGLMQISPIVLMEWNNQKSPPPILDTRNNIHHIEARFTRKALFNPEINKAIGLWYLKLLKKRLGKDYTLERLLASYNMGLSRLKKLNYEWWRIKETKNYVQKIIDNY